MTSRLQDFNSELWQKWASMGVIFLACGAMMYQDHATPRRPPPKHATACKSPQVQVAASHNKMMSAGAAAASSGARRSIKGGRLPLPRYQIYRLLLMALIALILIGIFAYFKSRHNNARGYKAHRYNMMPPS